MCLLGKTHVGGGRVGRHGGAMCEGDCAYVSLEFEFVMSKKKIELEVIYMSVVDGD
jgi:hypothetical protein